MTYEEVSTEYLAGWGEYGIPNIQVQSRAVGEQFQNGLVITHAQMACAE